MVSASGDFVWCGLGREFVWCQLMGTLCGVAEGRVCVVSASEDCVVWPGGEFVWCQLVGTLWCVA